MSNRRRLPRDHKLVLTDTVQAYVDKLAEMGGPNARNSYTCSTCHGTYVTVDIHPGVTPMLMRCYATEGCQGTAQSSWYRAVPDAEPTLEWHRPETTKGENPEMVHHLQNGGLAHRPAATAPDWVKATHKRAAS